MSAHLEPPQPAAAFPPPAPPPAAADRTARPGRRSAAPCGAFTLCSVVAVFVGVLAWQGVSRTAHPWFHVAVLTALVAGLVGVRWSAAYRRRLHQARERARCDGEARLSALVRHAADAVWVLDAEGVVQWSSRAEATWPGQEGCRVVGRPFDAALGETGLRWATDLLATARRHPGSPQRGSGGARGKDGREARLEVTVTDLLGTAAQHGIDGIVVNVHDVTARSVLEDELLHQAFHDPLTGLANRALLRDRIEHALARSARRGTSVALCLLDLDDFKDVNDGLGHGAGDELLVHVARRILEAIRASDTAARLGGDEFAVLTEDLDEAGGATGVAERLVEACRAPVMLGGREVLVTASVGLAIAGPGDDSETLLRNADAAMYAAKARARGGHAVFEPAMHETARENLELHSLLRTAVERDELAVAYHPIHKIASGAVMAVEALARWTPPGRPAVPPSRFIPLAEGTGLIVALGTAVLRRALRELAATADAWPSGRPPLLTVNVSARQLQDPGFAATLSDLLAETGLDGRQLCLELTESVFIQRTECVGANLDAIRRLGVRVGLDDFGTGYSSLASLHRFPLDMLKIPREFVEQLGRGEGGQMLAQSIVALSAALGLRTVAEGVETAEELAALRAIGCEGAQGFLFGPPAPLAEAIRRAHAVEDAWLRPLDASSAGVP